MSSQTSLRISTQWGLTKWLGTGCWLNELKVIFFFLKEVASQIKNPMYLTSSKYLLR